VSSGSGAIDAGLIVAGHRVGQIRIGANLDPIEAKLGNPTSPESSGNQAAMGHIWRTWHDKNGYSLSIYTVRGANDSAAHPEDFIQQIRVTSPDFHTRRNLHVGIAYSALPHSSSYKKAVTHSGVVLYDDMRHGLALEVKDGRCVSILVHPKKQPVTQIYLAFPSY